MIILEAIVLLFLLVTIVLTFGALAALIVTIVDFILRRLK